MVYWCIYVVNIGIVITSELSYVFKAELYYFQKKSIFLLNCFTKVNSTIIL